MYTLLHVRNLVARNIFANHIHAEAVEYEIINLLGNVTFSSPMEELAPIELVL